MYLHIAYWLTLPPLPSWMGEGAETLTPNQYDWVSVSTYFVHDCSIEWSTYATAWAQCPDVYENVFSVAEDARRWGNCNSRSFTFLTFRLEKRVLITPIILHFVDVHSFLTQFRQRRFQFLHHTLRHHFNGRFACRAFGTPCSLPSIIPHCWPLSLHCMFVYANFWLF